MVTYVKIDEKPHRIDLGCLVIFKKVLEKRLTVCTFISNERSLLSKLSGFHFSTQTAGCERSSLSLSTSNLLCIKGYSFSHSWSTRLNT